MKPTDLAEIRRIVSGLLAAGAGVGDYCEVEAYLDRVRADLLAVAELARGRGGKVRLCCGAGCEESHVLECPENPDAGDCEACGERSILERVHGAGLYCPSCAADHPLTIERARADANEDDGDRYADSGREDFHSDG